MHGSRLRKLVLERTSKRLCTNPNETGKIFTIDVGSDRLTLTTPDTASDRRVDFTYDAFGATLLGFAP